MRPIEDFSNGLFRENPTFRLILGMCPALAVTTAAINGLGMGLATTFVLVCSNTIISLLRKVIPEDIRIPAYIVVISSFVTVVQLVMQGFAPELYGILGIFVPLIVVNCIILARAEAFAGKYGVVRSAADGLGMGLGFTWALTLLGAVREVIGTGSLSNTYRLFLIPQFSLKIIRGFYDPALITILAPGAFITLGLMIGLMNLLTKHR
ncbi:MAG: electron transport complex subunit E [bacterium]|jgi:electron transport complex protein RnfE|nr:electron transport complex subunit E [bacterium]MDD3804663.1 electron transport complex subunit E [bacterium]MDD4153775.1 electron transport complex subunit E [bacterium]MDD4557468.1 electron transport complex subunit E [bacterium]